MARPASETWGHSTVRTACPLDCPDSCTLDVTVEKGRILKIDGGDANPATNKFICAKVRRFDERIYGEDRILHPAVRQGAKAPLRSFPIHTAGRTDCSRRTPTTRSCGAASARRVSRARSARRRLGPR